jgi:hypothetical protein
MNKILLPLLTLICTYASAQVPNFSFENWTTVANYEKPDNWATLNDYTALSNIFTATKATPGNPGSYYLKLTSKTIANNVVNGIAVSGEIDTLTMRPKSGFAFTSQPASFTGRWQHMIFGSSQGGITVVLTKWNTSTSSRDTVAIANHTLSGMAMSWANFTIPFVYQSTIAPDSCIIFLRASGANPTNNDYLWVDNLGFSGNVTSIGEPTSNIVLSVYPNPAKDFVTVSASFDYSEPVLVTMCDVSGRIVYSQSAILTDGNKMVQIPTVNLPSGLYTVSVQCASISAINKVIIE